MNLDFEEEPEWHAGYDYENPAIIYLDNGNQIRFYDGTGVNAFKAEEFKQLFQ